MARPTTRLGLASDMRAPAYEQRAGSTKPQRNRVRLEPAKVKSTKPPAHQVGRSPKKK